MQKEFGELDLVLRGSLSPLNIEFATDNLYQGLLDEIHSSKPHYVEQYFFNFYRPFNHKTSYYQKLIESATHNSCNAYIDDILESESREHQLYLFNSILEKALSNRLIEVVKIIRKHQFSLEFINPDKKRFADDEQHQSNTFIFQLLKIAYLKCYMEIQAIFNLVPPERIKSMEMLWSFYIRDEAASKKFLKHRPQLKISSVTEYSKNQSSQAEGYQKHNDTPRARYPERESKPFQSFECKKSIDYISNLLKKLDEKIGLIDHSRTTLKTFASILCSKNINELKDKIYLKCETTQFRYILDRLSPLFDNLSLINIEASEKFYTRRNTLLKASNLSRSKHDSPKNQKIIDRVITAHLHQN